MVLASLTAHKHIQQLLHAASMIFPEICWNRCTSCMKEQKPEISTEIICYMYKHVTCSQNITLPFLLKFL